MFTFLRSLLLFMLVFATAFLAHRTLVPNVVPVADGEQSNWQVQLAFVLVSLENIGLGGAGLVLVALILDRLQKARQGRNPG
jgi:hypothetical protein